MHKLLLSFMVISTDPSLKKTKNKQTTFTKYCLTQYCLTPGELWNPPSKAAPDMTGIVNATVYKTEPIFTGLRHGKLS